MRENPTMVAEEKHMIVVEEPVVVENPMTPNEHEASKEDTQQERKHVAMVVEEKHMAAT